LQAFETFRISAAGLGRLSVERFSLGGETHAPFPANSSARIGDGVRQCPQRLAVIVVSVEGWKFALREQRRVE